MNNNDEILIDSAYVKISNYRLRIINTLTTDTPKIPREISLESGIVMNHISGVLRELREKGLIECLNPNYRKGRLYVLTEKGELVKQHIKPQRYTLEDGSIIDTYTNKTYTNLEDIITLLNEQ